MSRAFNSNMKELLRTDTPPKSNKVLRLTANLGSVIAYVTQAPQDRPKQALPCWNKIKRKACPGKIDAGIDLAKFDILWHCLACGDHGTIAQWEHTIWDGKNR